MVIRLRVGADRRSVKNAGQRKMISNQINKNRKKEGSADEEVEMHGMWVHT